MSGKELTYKNRRTIEDLYNSGSKIKEIAKYLRVSLPTIYREISRGKYLHKNHDWTYTEKYSADKSQSVHDFYILARGKTLKLGNDYEFVKYLSKMIKKFKYSPQAIIADIKSNSRNFKTDISYKTIYRYVEAGLVPNVTTKDLPFRGESFPLGTGVISCLSLRFFLSPRKGRSCVVTFGTSPASTYL